MLEHVPHLALRPATELGRVDEDEMVALAAPHLARHELARVLDDPADRRPRRAWRRPCSPWPRRWPSWTRRRASPPHRPEPPPAMRRPCSAKRLSTRGGSPRRPPQPVGHPLPMRQLLGKDAEMPKAGQPAQQRVAEHLHGPGLGHRIDLRQRPASPSSSPPLPLNTASARSQTPGSSAGCHMACGSGRSTVNRPKRSSLRPLPESSRA